MSIPTEGLSPPYVLGPHPPDIIIFLHDDWDIWWLYQGRIGPAIAPLWLACEARAAPKQPTSESCEKSQKGGLRAGRTS